MIALSWRAARQDPEKHALRAGRAAGSGMLADMVNAVLASHLVCCHHEGAE